MQSAATRYARTCSRPAGRALLIAVVTAAVAGTSTSQAAAQTFYDGVRPVADVERRLRDEPFRIADWRGSRAPGDRTSRVAMVFADDTMLVAKWAVAPYNGATFNNEPRYEVAAYEIQKLFLDDAQHVVPPTLLRVFPLGYMREHMSDVTPTFRDAPGAVVVAIQFWLLGVQPDNFWDPRRAANDTVYARHIGNMNILTYLIRHSDENIGNFLISTDSANPRVYSVDNGVAFASPISDRGYAWRDLRVRRLPKATVERLRTITMEDLERTLAVLAEYEVQGDMLVPVEPGANLSPGRGVRRSGGRIQFGLTNAEIRGVENRLRQLLRQVDSGRIQVF